ncbi:hypothetical protein DFJ74DRAFT_655717 [Hyaloraphidium curvatum]|nr:hypothetical protein DFJ74DRAFT_655717 [Hyaloraphidium curvatum]
MKDLLGRFRSAAADGSEPPRSPSWLYVRLYYRFAAMCRARRRQESALVPRLAGIVLLPCTLVFAALFAAVGRCIPAWVLAYLVYLAIYLTVNAVNLASRNALIDSVTAVHGAAQRDLRTLVLARGPGPLADDAAMHCAALASFGEVQHHRAKLFGFVVSFGSVRTLLATGTTIAVALWTVLRAFGVSATLESFCFSGL